MTLKWRPTIPVQGDNVGGCVRDAFMLLFPDKPCCAEIPGWVELCDFPALCEELGASFFESGKSFHVDYGAPCIVIYRTRPPATGHAVYIKNTIQLHDWDLTQVSAVIIRK